MEQLVARAGKGTVLITPIRAQAYRAWLKKQNATTRAWLSAIEFSPDAGKVALVPERNGRLGRVILGLGQAPDLWAYAALVDRLPAGRYAFDDTLPRAEADMAALGWALAGYAFTRYKERKKKLPSLVWPKGSDRAAVERIVTAVTLGRDLVNTPASDLGPEELAGVAEELAGRHAAKFSVIVGESLLEKNFPAIYAVGKASARAPRLVDLRWGSPRARRLTLVGKGVCFDSGGLDLKSAAGMKLMKKDMGGAASVLALAHMIMDAGLDVRLRVLIPAVENAVSGNAYRPGDVLATRKGLTVEVGNTDAEGRLVLCDALTEADAEEPDLLVDFATLTGAARVALGTELPALFCTADDIADAVLTAGNAVADPLWRMPLFQPYQRHLDSKIADVDNIASVSEGGAIHAALFLQRFLRPQTSWAHVDTMAWNVRSRPGRPAGGEVFGVRAFFEALRDRYAP